MSGETVEEVPEDAEFGGSATATAPTPRLRVIIADDDPLARRVVRDKLQADGITVVAEASSGREAIELTLYYKPDLVLMDVLMPDTDGIAATRAITAQDPSMIVVMLTANDDQDVGLLGLRAGASGFLSKSHAVDTLPSALRSAAAGEAVVPGHLTMRLVDGLRRARHDGAGIRPVRSTLTSREWEVLDLLCDGLDTAAIADSLVLSPETVNSHIKSVKRKLGARTRKDAVEATRRLRAELILAETSSP
jgi:NarL family two-component system response regulator LiaR